MLPNWSEFFTGQKFCPAMVWSCCSSEPRSSAPFYLFSDSFLSQIFEPVKRIWILSWWVDLTYKSLLIRQSTWAVPSSTYTHRFFKSGIARQKPLTVTAISTTLIAPPICVLGAPALSRYALFSASRILHLIWFALCKNINNSSVTYLRADLHLKYT